MQRHAEDDLIFDTFVVASFIVEFDQAKGLTCSTRLNQLASPNPTNVNSLVEMQLP